MGKTEINILNSFIILIILIFFLWYIPISYLNVFSLDDFWHGANVKKYGFWQAQLFYYFNWEGSYEHTFFATLPHSQLFNWLGNKTPFIINIITFFTLVFSFTISLYNFLFNKVKSDIKQAIFTATYIAVLFYTISSTKNETIFWVCINFTYVMGISFLLLGINLFFSRNYILKFFSLFFLIFFVGNKINYVAFGICFLLILLFQFRNTIKLSYWLVFVSLIITIGVLFNFLAPGNLIRLKGNIIRENVKENYSIIQIFIFKLLNYEVPFFLKSVLYLYPITIFTFNNHSKIKLKFLTYCLLSVLSCLVIDSIIFFICFKDPGPIRSNFLLEFLTLILSFGVASYIYSELKNSKFANYFVLSISFISLIYIELNNFKYIDTAKNYSIASINRNNLMIKDCKSESDNLIELAPLPISGILNSYGCNDTVWLNNVYVNYFNCKKNIVLKNAAKN